jgi:hypothetical protein
VESPQVLYHVTVKESDEEVEVLDFHEGDTVSLEAAEDETKSFEYWSVTPQSVSYTQAYDKKAKVYTITFIMPAGDVTVERVYTILPEAIRTYVEGFADLYESAVAAKNDPAEQPEQTYLDSLEDAIVYYQSWLADPQPELIGTVDSTDMPLDAYVLRTSVKKYLKDNDQKDLISTLAAQYQELCILYAKGLFESIDPLAIDRTRLEETIRIYELLGTAWQTELEQLYQDEQAQLNGQTVQTDSDGGTDDGQQTALTDVIPTISETLQAYQVMLQFQEYLQEAAQMSEEEQQTALQEIWSAYLFLTDIGKTVVEQDPSFETTMREHGLWVDETEEPATDNWDYYGDYDGYDDYGGYDDDDYTAQELQEEIEAKEQEIKDCELNIRSQELTVAQKQRVVDGKTVKSTMDGTVISIGDIDGTSDNDYFVKVANVTGLYARGVMSELSMEQIHVGDTISGITDNGDSFTAVIKEISEYPDADGASMRWGSGNSNASYYPFYALIDDSSDIEEGGAEIQLSDTIQNYGDGIYLEKYFVRTGNDGRSYVYKQGEDGLLTKQYITTGKTVYSYAIEITSGLTEDDKIAFPYGSSVEEGAKTKEVDMLSY